MADPTPTPYRSLGITVPVTDLLDPKKWRELYAFGITLGVGDQHVETDSIAKILGCAPERSSKTLRGRELKSAATALQEAACGIPDTVIAWHLRAATSDLEIKLGIPLGLVVAKGTPVDAGLVRGQDYDVEVPRKEYTISNARNYYRIDLPAGVVSVQRIRAYWFTQLVWSISEADGNLDLIQFEHPGISSLHILPTQSATLLITMPEVGGFAYGSMQLIGGYPSPLPSVWSVDYTIAPRARYGAIGEVEAALAHWVYCRAGVLLLSIGGRAASRGLTNASLSIDGLSKSIGLAGMGAINKALEDRLKEATEAINWEQLRLYKRGLRVVPYGA